MEINRITLSATAPQSKEVIWAHPVEDNLVELLVCNNGKWSKTTIIPQTIFKSLEDLNNALNNHKNDYDNPHKVTKSQVGLGNVDNTSDADKPVSTAQESRISEAEASLNKSIGDHIEDTSNPHRVTKNQVGLSNVDNTSDVNKPISTATQEALDAKEDSFTVGSGLEMTPERKLNITLDLTVFFIATSLPETPTEDQKKKICLVPQQIGPLSLSGKSSEVDNVYTEYIWAINDTYPDGYWEEIGNFRAGINLSNYATIDLVSTKQNKTDKSLTTSNKTIVGAINEINSKPSGVGKIDPNSKNTGEIFNDYSLNMAWGEYSHSEGKATNSAGEGSHSEGLGSRASGEGAHSEGCSVANGDYSHSEGFETIAYNNYEHAQGKYNISNRGDTDDLKTIHSIGIGILSEKKNAQEVMVNGDHYIINIGGYNGTNPSDSKTLQEIINNLVNNVPVITEQTLSDNYEIPVNATNQEYIYKLTIGDTLYNITGASGITWQNGVAPITQVNKTYMISVINNLATWGEF